MGLIRRILSYCVPYTLHLLMLFGIILVRAYADVQIPQMYRSVMDKASKIGLDITLQQAQKFAGDAFKLAGLMLLTSAFHLISEYTSTKVGAGIAHKIRMELYTRVQKFPFQFFTSPQSEASNDKDNTGDFNSEIVTLLNHELVGAETAISVTIPHTVFNLWTVIFTFYTMFKMNVALTCVVALTLSLYRLPAHVLGDSLKEIKKEGIHARTKLNSYLGDTLSANGVLLMKNFGKEKQFMDHFDENSSRVVSLALQRTWYETAMYQMYAVVVAMGTSVMMGVGVMVLLLLDSLGDITPGSMVAFMMYMNRIAGPLSDLLSSYVEFQTTSVCFEKVFRYLDMYPEQEKKEEKSVKQLDLQAVAGANVSFAYPSGGKQVQVLSDVSFDIKPGQLVLVVGPNGAGKTTISYLLSKLHEPTSGSIYIDEHNINLVTQESIHRHIGNLSQDPYFVNDTVYNNLAVAISPDTKPEQIEEEIHNACKAVKMHEFILSLPRGYDTPVGNRGYSLSAGQRQRLAIARMIIKNPSIYIMDEFTAHLDSQNQLFAEEVVKNIVQDQKKACILITHTIKNSSLPQLADQIIVLEEGRCVQTGSHQELRLNEEGLYFQLSS